MSSCAGQYDFDYLMMMAQGYQESMLEQSVRSPGGAVGIMQVMPSDAAASPISVPDVWTAEGNIHAGIKMVRTIEDQYLNDPKIGPLNKLCLRLPATMRVPTASRNSESRHVKRD
jgi:membrane-bound lytic murein transglycosylase MltF